MRNAPSCLAVTAALLFTATSQAATPPAKAPPAKAAGVVRICLVQPKVQMAGADAAKSANTVRDILVSYLQGPTMDVAVLAARLPSQYALEAAKADCNFVLTSTLTQKRGSAGGKSGNLLNKLSSVTPYVPPSAKTEIASRVVESAKDFAATTKARDDMQLDIKLDALGNPDPVLTKSLKRKAKSDGEDLLTPLVEGAAEAVGATLDGQ